VGAGANMKLVVNMVMGTMLASYAEGERRLPSGQSPPDHNSNSNRLLPRLRLPRSEGAK
jgi:hypothetical protein